MGHGNSWEQWIVWALLIIIIALKFIISGGDSRRNFFQAAVLVCQSGPRLHDCIRLRGRNYRRHAGMELKMYEPHEILVRSHFHRLGGPKDRRHFSLSSINYESCFYQRLV